MPFQAHLRYAGLHALVQTLELNRRSVVVAVAWAAATGRITVENGTLADARVGDLRGVPAFAALAAWEGGTCRLEPFAPPAERTITAANEAVLAESPESKGSGGEPESELRIEGDLADFPLAALIELYAFNGRMGKITDPGGHVIVGRRSFVEAVAGEARGEDALVALLRLESGAFLAVPAGQSILGWDRPIHVPLAAALERLADERAARPASDRGARERLQSLLDDLRDGRVGRAVRLALARRLLPDAEVAPIELTVRLCGDADGEVRAAALDTLEEAGLEVLEAVVSNPATPAPVVAHLIQAFRCDAEFLAIAATYPGMDEAMAVRLAQLADPQVAEALLRTKWGGMEAVRQALQRDAGEARAQAAPAPATAPAPASAAPKPAAPGARHTPGARPPGGGKIAARKPVTSLSRREQVYLAASGNMRQQLSLVTSNTQEVACAVASSPRLNESIVLSIAGLTTANAEALRDIAQNRKWSNQYPIARMLAFNPKVPPRAVIDLLPRLLDGDLKGLGRSGGISEVVRSAALRVLTMREEKRKLK